MLSREGMRTVQVIGVPDGRRLPRCRCGGRRAEIAHHPGRRGGRAVAAAREGAAAAGARADSASNTARPSIPPIAAISARWPMRCWSCSAPTSRSPARPFPTNGRTVYQGHLFVGDAAAVREPDEGPSADADARRQSGARAAAPDQRCRSGSCRCQTVEQGADAIARRLRRKLRAAGRAASPSSTRSPTRICSRSARPAPHALVTGGSGIAMGLPENFRAPACSRRAPAPTPCRRPPGRRRHPGRLLLGRDARPDRGGMRRRPAGVAARPAGHRRRRRRRAQRSLAWAGRNSAERPAARSIPAPIPSGRARCRSGSAASAPARWSRSCWPMSRAGLLGAASRGSWSRAARRRARWSRRLA